MNQYISDWSGAMGDTFVPPGGDDDGLIELLWCNGQVVTQSQGPLRKPPRPDKATAPAVVQDDDAAAAARPWFQYPVVEDPLERDDLFSDIFGEAQAVVDGARTACCKQEADEAARQSSGMMPPPPPLRPREEKACPGPGDGAPARTSAGFEATATEGAAESSMLTIGSSFCGSNHVQTPPPPRARGGVLPGDAATPPGNGKDVTRARDGATATSSATRSRSCTTKCEQPGADAGAGAAAAHRSGKRKQSDAMAAEDVEFESAADVTCQPAAQKTTSAKRRRAAEIHNLSERRRRDRINEKMKALQELIPYCNKTDKASMLDEAIEYLKSLQLQLQMMWMGGGMAAAAAATAPVVFPAGVHQYMQRMVAGPPPHHVSSMPGMPFMAPPPVHQGPPLPDLYARYLAVDHLSPPPPPPPPLVAPPPYTIQQHCLQQGTMDFYQRQQNPALPPPTDAVPPAAAAPPDGILHKKYENCGKPEIQGMTG